jgi:hypothetical protein
MISSGVMSVGLAESSLPSWAVAINGTITHKTNAENNNLGAQYMRNLVDLDF